MREVLVKGGYWGRIDVGAGERLQIVNVEGTQICDFFAFRADDIGEFLSPAHTRAELMRLTLGAGDRLVSVRRAPMFEIVEDTVGSHDMIFPACDPPRYKLGFGLDDHRSCRANLAEAMADRGIAYEHLPDPINFFQNTPVGADGTIAYGRASVARPGDKVVLKALVDAVAVASACAMDLTGINGERLSDIRLAVREA